MRKSTQLIGPFKQLLPMHNISKRGPLADDSLEIIKDGAILVRDGLVQSVGNFEELYKVNDPAVYEIEDEQVGCPGFIDVHTHICFGGTRSRDFALRNSGKSYLDIAKAGGGIWQTVSDTRKESQATLELGILKRIEKTIQNGITTIEIKSGYGLSVLEELKMLRAIKESSTKSKIDIIPTCLAAHIFPKDFHGKISEYLHQISQKLFPILKAENLSNRIDAFIEEEAFSAELISPYLATAKQMGFDICIHADQFTPGASKVAVDFEALSADHLEASTDAEIDLLAKSTVIPVALPGASIGLGCHFAPARKLLNAGTSLVIASDWNPGSAPMGDLLTQACIFATFEKLSNTELLSALTCRAASALNLTDRGSLSPNKIADFISFSTDDYREIFYNQGQMKPSYVWKKACIISTIN